MFFTSLAFDAPKVGSSPTSFTCQNLALMKMLKHVKGVVLVFTTCYACFYYISLPMVFLSKIEFCKKNLNEITSDYVCKQL